MSFQVENPAVSLAADVEAATGGEPTDVRLAELQPLIDKGMQESLTKPDVREGVESVAMAVYGRLTESAPNWCVALP